MNNVIFSLLIIAAALIAPHLEFDEARKWAVVCIGFAMIFIAFDGWINK